MCAPSGAPAPPYCPHSPPAARPLAGRVPRQCALLLALPAPQEPPARLAFRGTLRRVWAWRLRVPQVQCAYCCVRGCALARTCVRVCA
eukprot:342898-Chlamydomonas_euryale.AAC.1